MVEVPQARLVLCKENNMPRVQAAAGEFEFPRQRHHFAVHARKVGDPLFQQTLCQPVIDQTAGQRVVRSAVMVEFRQLERFGDDVQLVLFQLRQELACQHQRVDVRGMKFDVQVTRGSSHEADVELRIVRHQRTIPAEAKERRQYLGDLRCALQHRVRDTGQLDVFLVEPALRIDEGLEGVQHLAVLNDHRTKLRNSILCVGKAGRFQIKCDKFPIQREAFVAVCRNAVVGNIEEIALTAVKDLDVLIRSGDLVLRCLERVREGGSHAVIGDRDSLMAPAGRRRDGITGLGQCVHHGHRGMQMQFHALFGRGVLALRRLRRLDGDRLKHDVVFKAAEADLAEHAQPHTWLCDFFDDRLGQLRIHIAIDAQRAGVICHVKRYNPCVAFFELLVVDRKHPALDDHPTHIVFQRHLSHRHGRPAEGLAEKHGRSRLRGFFLRCVAAEGRRGNVLHRRLPELLRFLEQRLALHGASRHDLDLRLQGKALHELTLRHREIGCQRILAVGAQVEHRFPFRDLPTAARQCRGGGRIGGDQAAVQLGGLHLRRTLLGKPWGNGHHADAVARLQALAERLQILRGDIAVEAHLQRNAPLLPADLRTANRRLL